MPKYPPMSPEVYQYIIDKRLLYCNGNYLEFGSWVGGGVCSMAKRFPNKIFYCIDDFSKDGNSNEQCEDVKNDTRNKFLENNEKLFNVKLFEIDSNTLLKSFLNKEWIKKTNIDTILIDGGHDYSTVINDINVAVLILKDKDGFLFFHDAIGKEDVKKAVDEFREKYKNQIISEDTDGDGKIFLTKFI